MFSTAAALTAGLTDATGSMIVVSVGVGLVTVLRPSWRSTSGLLASAVVWTWIDMEGPVLVGRDGHGLHLADVPVVLAVLAVGVAGGRLLWRQRASRS